MALPAQKLRPIAAVEDLCCASPVLIEGWNNAFARYQWLVAGEASSDGAVEVGVGIRCLEASGDVETFELLGVKDHFSSAGTGGLEVDGDEDAADPDLVILKGVVPGMQVSVELQADAGMKFLRPSVRPAVKWNFPSAALSPAWATAPLSRSNSTLAPETGVPVAS